MSLHKLAPFAIWCALSLSTLRAQIIITNTAVKLVDISKTDLADIFTGAANSFSDGSRAVPATLKAGALHEAFLKQYIGKKDLLFRGDWRVLVFSGKATMPKAFATEEELVEYVASVPGAIGYVTVAPRNPQVKSLRVR
jgi:ABC-type phosphate transport system substrate-binding protein